MSGEGMRFRVAVRGTTLGDYYTPLVGEFNARNCLAAIAVGECVGASRDAVREALATFQSVKRRMQVRGVRRGVRVIDDFAHHPTAVRETLAAVRSKYPRGRLVAVYEPRSLTSRQRVFQSAYEAAFDLADLTVIARVFDPDRYANEERFSPEEFVEALAARGREAHFLGSADEIVTFLTPRLADGDTVAVMSNGGFDDIHTKLLDALE
jgi:UDP-N-acetylmuramate: L-alanyl-gamma-D-glutamyl-meso-diaminopimelate ligase